MLRRADELPETSKENSGAVHRAPPGFAWSGMRLGTSHPAGEGASAGSGTRCESPQGRVSSKVNPQVAPPSSSSCGSSSYEYGSSSSSLPLSSSSSSSSCSSSSSSYGSSSSYLSS